MDNPAPRGNQRILIIDDNRAIHGDFQKVLAARLASPAGLEDAERELFGENTEALSNLIHYRIDSAYQGQEGLLLVEKARQESNPYAVAFVDVRMPPGWDGIETAARLWEVDPDLQIVICTAYSDYSWSDMRKKLGRSDRLVILKKPFDQIEILQMASSLTRKWDLLQESRGRLVELERLVVARTLEMIQEKDKLKAIFENSPEGIFQSTPAGRFLSANPALAEIYGYASPAELIECVTDIETQLYVEPGRRREFQRRLDQEHLVRDFQVEVKCKDGSRKWISQTACKVLGPDDVLLHYQGFVLDITAQKEALHERSLMEIHLRQAQKLESVGQLAAGIAHEINTPIQYVGDNIRFVGEAFFDLNRLLLEYQRLAATATANAVTPEILSAVAAASARTDLAFLGIEIPKALQQSLDGVSHVANIVRAMKEFSHPGEADKVLVDLNHAIQTTLTVARNEWKYVADIETAYGQKLPLVPCIPSDFNQVILNLVVNAAHAISDVIKNTGSLKGVIKISTRQLGAGVEIRISDTGAGIPENIQHRIFEPFFTTKEVGRGTGQGLAIARSTIVSKHSGRLTFESKKGQGTTFIIWLPICPIPAIKKVSLPIAKPSLA